MTVASKAGLIEIAPGVHVWIGSGGSSNAGVVETLDGLVFFDALQTIADGTRLRRDAEQRLAMPVRCLVNSHFHLDHTAGNHVFRDVPIVAHQRTKQRLVGLLGETNRNEWLVADVPTKLKLFFGDNFSDIVPAGDRSYDWFLQRIGSTGSDVVRLLGPTSTFADGSVSDLPDETLKLHYWGPAHCDGDIVLHLPAVRAIFLGDLLFIGRFPWLGDCDLDGWISVLERVLTLNVDVVVPGHGPPGTLSDVADFRDLLASLRAGVERALAEGLSEDAAVATVSLPTYAAMQRYSIWLPANIRSAYRYLSGRAP